MKIAYFDCFAGISGDMAVGALLDAGVPLVVVENAMEQLGLAGRLTLGTRTLVRSMIQATKFDVLNTAGEPIDRTPHEHEHAHEHSHAHEHTHPHEHSHTHEHTHAHPHTHSHQHAHTHEHTHPHGHAHEQAHAHPHDHHHPHEHSHSHPHHNGGGEHHHDHEHASYSSIVGMIERSALADGVKSRAVSILREIGIAEGRIHGMPLEEVHFHEVGALDSIADIVAVAACLEHLGVEAVFTSTIPLGSGGTIRTQHGVMPLPAPATLEILKGYPVQLTSLPFELTTPTGAGIVKALSRGGLALERVRVERVGFGAGTRELPDRPNLLRVAIGEMLHQEEYDDVMLVESTIDDMNPQIYPWLIERLLESGALDAWITPVTMKKGRPGIVLSVVAPAGAVDAVAEVIYRETTTIGVRFAPYGRRKLQREEVLVPTPWGAVRMKRIFGVDGVRFAPEYEEARRIARENGLSLRQVMTTLGEIARTSAEQMRGGE